MRALLTVLVFGCRPPDDPPSDGPTVPSDPPSTPLPTGTTGTTGTTGDTGTVETPGTTPTFDCSAPLPTGPFVVDSYDIRTTEDFDFDALGSVVYSSLNGSFLAVDSYGDTTVVAPSIEDTRGIQVLSDGNIAAAYIGEGRVGLTDRNSGAGVTLIGGLAAPNALEVGAGDLIYVSETSNGGPGPRVITYDPATGDTREVARGFTYPNGLALNQAQDRLFVSDSAFGIWMIEKDATGEWGPKQLLFDPPYSESYDAIEVDVCGHVYVLHFYHQAGFLWNSIRWGSGRGIWQRDVLYVTDRNKIFGVHVGIPGRSQPVDAMP